MCKRINLDADLTPFTKMNSKWITELNVKYKTIKLLEDNRVQNLGDFEFSRELLDSIPKAQSVKEKKLISWTSLKLKFLLCKRHC